MKAALQPAHIGNAKCTQIENNAREFRNDVGAPAAFAEAVAARKAPERFRHSCRKLPGRRLGRLSLGKASRLGYRWSRPYRNGREPEVDPKDESCRARE